ncbi:hypothetical protein FHS82_000771 [Pseudochelatococcus lubricantis]|uniref:DUF1013 domain-containing protein n=1 Tax=Pseudochelatococcus lubricantis TaxID=1538102 RepID=A0ABX0UYE8_9HYPH|nr:cell cycle transcriptional regulator TrcR [Pseudochelatococcus lubricantis]NIJ56945.1 hypothetical protein [Pseudochelatococcus lubricantis]
MSTGPLMPKATAVWLVDNTALTFSQIAEFCKLHPLEVKGIADGEVAAGIKGLDPTVTGQLTREEIGRGEADPSHVLRLSAPKVKLPEAKRRRGPRYTPVSRRQDRPNAILWLLRNHPELKDAQIMRLVGTTKTTIEQIRDRSHWNSANLTPADPVTLGLCSQIDLDFEVSRSAKDAPARPQVDGGQSLLPTEVSTAPDEQPGFASSFGSAPSKRREDEDIDVDSVFAKLKTLKRDDDADADDESTHADDKINLGDVFSSTRRDEDEDDQP